MIVGHVELEFSIIAGLVQILLETRITVGFPNAYSLHLASYPIMISNRHLLLLTLVLTILFQTLGGRIRH